jgi:hypothetical protein
MEACKPGNLSDAFRNMLGNTAYMSIEAGSVQQLFDSTNYAMSKLPSPIPGVGDYAFTTNVVPPSRFGAS